MPCYDSNRMPWEDDQRKNEIRAVQILCKHITAAINSNSPLESDLIEWYIAHRTIDLGRALAGFHNEAIDSIKASIDKARFLLT